MTTIKAAFAGNPRPRTKAELLAAGLTEEQISEAVRDDMLRTGITGYYWLPAPPDPGAVAVMRRAMREKPASEEE